MLHALLRSLASTTLVAGASLLALSAASAAPKRDAAATVSSASVAPTASTTSKARVLLGPARAVGGSTLPAAAASQLARVESALQICWTEERAKGEIPDASLDVRLEIVGPGRVASATISGSAEASSSLRGCARDAFAGFFAGSVGPAPVEALLHVEFDGDDAEAATRPISACPTDCDGELDDDALAAIRERAREAAVCFKRAAAPGEPTTLKAGAVDVQLRIASDGSTCGVALVGDSFGRPSLGSCLREKFESPLAITPRGCVDVRVPMKFKGS